MSLRLLGAWVDVAVASRAWYGALLSLRLLVARTVDVAPSLQQAKNSRARERQNGLAPLGRIANTRGRQRAPTLGEREGDVDPGATASANSRRASGRRRKPAATSTQAPTKSKLGNPRARRRKLT